MKICNRNSNAAMKILAAILVAAASLVPLSSNAHHKHHHIVLRPVIVKPVPVHKPHKHHPFVVVRPARSHVNALWVPGHWRRNGHRHVWIVGHWR